MATRASTRTPICARGASAPGAPVVTEMRSSRNGHGPETAASVRSEAGVVGEHMDRQRRAVVVAGVMCAMFLAAMESTVVATAMPTVIASLGGIRIYAWVFSAFLLCSTATMPLWGWLADQHGRRRAYLGGL